MAAMRAIKITKNTEGCDVISALVNESSPNTSGHFVVSKVSPLFYSWFCCGDISA